MRTLLISRRAHLLADLLARDSVLEQVPGNLSRAATLAAIRSHQPDLIVAFGCNTILPVAELNGARAINLHTSLLPWCRGTMPHLWTFVEGTPPGVSLHEMDAGIDTGPIVAQEEIDIPIESHSLQSVYDLLHARVALLFARTWPLIRDATYHATPQPRGGSYHTLRMHQPFQAFLDENVHSPLSWLVSEIKKNWPRPGNAA